MARSKSRAAKEGKATVMGKALWFRAMRWRREVDRELAASGLTFTQWMILEAADDLIREKKESVNQNAIAAHIELDKMTVSQVMRTLTDRGLTDRGPAEGRPAYRILLTARGQRAVAEGRTRVEAASKRCQAELRETKR
jgi:DNA-binding MarR family transcriptional regulator